MIRSVCLEIVCELYHRYQILVSFGYEEHSLSLSVPDID